MSFYSLKVKKNGFYGLLNDKCHLIIPIQYEEIQFSEINNYGTTILYIVCKRNKYGLIKYIVDSKKSSNETIIEIRPFIYDNIQIKHDIREKPYLIVRENGLYGLTTINGIFVIPPKYEEIKEIKEEDYIWELSDRSYLITQNNKYGIFRRKFEIIPCIFDSIEYDGCEVLCKCNNHIYRYDKYGERVRYNAAFGYLKRTERSGSNIKYYYSPFHEDKNSVDLIY